MAMHEAPRSHGLRDALACAAAAVAVLAIAAPAYADVDVESDRPQQGSKNATLTFVAEAVSHKAGITSLRVTLPKGIVTDDVTLVTAPPDWTMRPRKGGYEVRGPALEVGESARYSVRVARLPQGRSWLAFATTQRYDNGRADRWVELPKDEAEASAPRDGHPAPVLELAAVATAPVAPQKPVKAAGSSRTGTLIGVSIAILLVAGAAVWWVLRRGRSTGAHH